MEILNSVFLPMLTGHLIADFWLQPNLFSGLTIPVKTGTKKPNIFFWEP